MTLITSKHFDDNFLNAEYLRIATQVNSDKGTSLPVGKNYDMNRMSALVRALVVAVNDEYSASLVPVSKSYDRNMLGEMLNRVATVVNDGGGGDYVASAVHFDGDPFAPESQSYLRATLSGSPISAFAGACWVKAEDVSQFLFLFNQAFDNEGSIVPGISVSTGFNFSSDIVIYVRDPTGSSSGRTIEGSADELFVTGEWHLICWSADINAAQGSKSVQLLYDGSDAIDHDNDVDLGGAFTVALEGTTLTIPGWNGAEGVPCDMADFQMWFGRTIDWSSPTNLAKVISSGKPVDPAIAATAFGQQSILFSGDSSTFATNQGTVSGFTLTGPLTNATTSPSD